MSKKIKIMILLIVFITVSILLTNIISSNAKERLDSESTYTIVMDGQTTTVEKGLTEEDYDIAQQIMEERAKDNKNEIALANSSQSESVQRAVEELETIHQLVSKEVEEQDSNNIEDGIPQMPKSIIEEQETMKKDLENIAKKYNKSEQFNNLMAKLEKREDTSEFTEDSIAISELFIDIYNNNELDESEKESIKEFEKMVSLNNLPSSLQNKIDKIIE